MKRLSFFLRSRRARLFAGLALAVSAASVGCSLITKEDAAQCKSNSDCSALGFDGATCNVSAGVCMRSDGSAGTSSSGGTGGNTEAAGSGGSSAGNTSSAGTSNGGHAGSAEAGGSAGALTGGNGGEAGELGGSSGSGGSGMGGAGGCAGNCLNPVGLRFVESAPVASFINKKPLYQPPGTLLGPEEFHTDVCPQDQVLTGLNLSFGTESSGNKFLLNVRAVCSAPSLSTTTPRKLQLGPGATLPARGNETSVNSSIVSCGAGQVVTGWSGIEDSAHISQFVLRCASLAVNTDAKGVVTLSVGMTNPVVPPAGYTSAATPLAAQDCAANFVARGINVRLSDAMVSPQRLERFEMACGRPSITYPKGAACKADGDCDSGACTAGFCVDRSCTPGAACSCELLDTREYMFCVNQAAFTDAAGALGCGASNMRLVKIDDGVENGWLFSTGLLHFPTSTDTQGEWIGATDAAQEGAWLWVDQAQTQFWSGMNIDQGGTPVGGLYSAWKRVGNAEEPNNGHGGGNPAENCAFMDIGADDRWVDTPCTDTRHYVCEYEDGR